MNDLTRRLAQAVLDEYKVYPDYFQEKYCRFCGTHTKQQVSVLSNGQKDHQTLWIHTADCVVPPAEDFLNRAPVKSFMDEVDEGRKYIAEQKQKDALKP